MDYYRVVWGDDYLDFDRNYEFRLTKMDDNPGLIVLCDARSCPRTHGAFVYHPLPGVTLTMIRKECNRLCIQNVSGVMGTAV